MAFRPNFVVARSRDKTLASLAVTSSGKPQISTCQHSGRASFLVSFVVLSCLLSYGRTDPQTDLPTFQSSIELVSVPVVVKNRQGNRIHGLTKDNFRIFENGHAVEIRSFASAASEPGTSSSAPVPAKLQRPPLQEFGLVPIILFFDQLNTPANEQAAVRRTLARWYQNQQTLATPTCVILYSGSALRILQQPTTEAARVRGAIESIPTTINSHGAGAAGELPLPPGANENLPPGNELFVELRQLAQLEYFWRRATSAGDTQSALIYAGRLFAALPGEKALIWISAGTTTPIWTAPLQAAQVRLYPLNVHADVAYEFIASMTDTIGGVDEKTGSLVRGQGQETHEYLTDVNRQLRENMREAAEETGGEFCNNPLEPSSCVQKAMEDGTDHYLLSYETHSRSSHPEWRQIQVKVNRPGLAVYSRTGVMIAPNLRTEEKKREQITAALASPLDLPGLWLELQPIPPNRPGQELTLSLLIRSDAKRPGVWNTDRVDFTVVGGVLRGSDVVQRFGEDVHGSLSPETVSELDASGFTWAYKVAVPNDAVAVRLVVRDNTTDRIGSITRSLP